MSKLEEALSGLSPEQQRLWEPTLATKLPPLARFLQHQHEPQHENQTQDQGATIAGVGVESVAPDDPVALFAEASADTWTISAPGTYVLDRDICAAGNAAQAAIIIASDNVVLDLGGHTVQSSKTSPMGFGIFINSGHQNVSISNGKIKRFLLFGIYCDALNTGVTLNRLCVKNISNELTGGMITTAGIFFVASSKIVVKKCQVISTTSATGNTAGILFVLCDQVSVTHTTSRKNVNFGGPVSGMQCLICTNTFFGKCLVEDCSTKPGVIAFPSHTVGGFYAVLCSQLKIHNCTARRLTSACDDCHGFPIFLCPTTVELVDCLAEDIKDGFNDVTHTGAKATGFEIDGTNNAVIRRCTARRVVTHNPEDKQGAGFTSGLCTNVQFIECVSTDHKSVGKSKGVGVGFGWAPDPRPAFIGLANGTKWIKCVSKRNDVGFDLFNHTNGLMEKCTSSDNRKYGLANGFTRTVSCHPCTECNPALTTTIPNDGQNNVVRCNRFKRNCKANMLETKPSARNAYIANKCCQK